MRIAGKTLEMLALCTLGLVACWLPMLALAAACPGRGGRGEIEAWAGWLFWLAPPGVWWLGAHALISRLRADPAVTPAAEGRALGYFWGALLGGAVVAGGLALGGLWLLERLAVSD
ncbi:MAG TPA: hypothetical protein VGE07_17845 [Herpetosiphonaceae bacterium]